MFGRRHRAKFLEEPVPIPSDSSWRYVPEDSSKRLTEELKKEIGPLHSAFHCLNDLVVVAKNDASDDVLVFNRQKPIEFLVVHLTWAGKVDQFPETCPDTRKILREELAKFFEQA